MARKNSQSNYAQRAAELDNALHTFAAAHADLEGKVTKLERDMPEVIACVQKTPLHVRAEFTHSVYTAAGAVLAEHDAPAGAEAEPRVKAPKHRARKSTAAYYQRCPFNADRARDARLKLNKSQEELANELGLTRAYITRVESGKYMPDLRNMMGRVYVDWLQNNGYSPRMRGA